MRDSIFAAEVQNTLSQAKTATSKEVKLNGHKTSVPTPFPSPEDWRDKWIYFLMVDRFNNPKSQPKHLPYNTPIYGYQGGTLNGIREELSYLKTLGVGAIWLSPVLKNCQMIDNNPGESYHGYGIQDFLTVEPRFGSTPAAADNEFQALVDEAHAQGLYVIMDIVLNHTGNVFAYNLIDNGNSHLQSMVSYSSEPYSTIAWRDKQGQAQPNWNDAATINHPDPDATVWPQELRHNDYFRRQGSPQGVSGSEVIGDFGDMKQMLTMKPEAQQVLIRAYQYLIAKYDIDGFRIDTLKYLPPDFARVFGNSIREYCLSIGKKNFFTFGEVYGSEEDIAHFIGRNAGEVGDLVGVDAALDFPLFYKLPPVMKAMNNQSPQVLVDLYETRKTIEKLVLSSHGEATRFFVTFLDNHDQKTRFYYQQPGNPQQYDDQLTMALACLFALQGIPCLYYGTEQGLHGSGGTLEDVREALWGKPNAFSPNTNFYRELQKISKVREQTPALRYGRQYFRPLSGDKQTFSISNFCPGVVAFSRILNDQEVVIVANTDPTNKTGTLAILVDGMINPAGTKYKLLYSNKAATATLPGPVEIIPQGVNIYEVHAPDSSVVITNGPASAIVVNLQPMEVQILEPVLK